MRYLDIEYIGKAGPQTMGNPKESISQHLPGGIYRTGTYNYHVKGEEWIDHHSNFKFILQVYFHFFWRKTLFCFCPIDYSFHTLLMGGSKIIVLGGHFPPISLLLIIIILMTGVINI